MTTSKFDQQVLIEQLRLIEAEAPLVDDMADQFAQQTRTAGFSERLWIRAKHLVVRNDLAHVLHRAEKLTGLAIGAGIAVAGVLGALAAKLALSGGNTINIYWLLLVLLGFNFFSMLIWLVGVSVNSEGLMTGVLAKATRWIPAFLTKKNQNSAAADRAWLASHFGGRVGKWQLSALTHCLWLVYLLAGLAVVLLVLMARQYDFVWGTTLLSDGAFVRLTEWLGSPLQALGLSTPTPEQVLQTRLGHQSTFSASHSNVWAQFLIGALLVYGVVPRLLLWVWSLWMRASAKRSFTPDYYLPYYIELRQQLRVYARTSEICDDDEVTNDLSGSSQVGVDDPNAVAKHLPVDASWVAVELGEELKWPPGIASENSDLGQVNDRQSLASIMEKLKNANADCVVIAVAARRAPDRGIQRTIVNLLECSKEPWLVLLLQPENDSIPQARLGAWYRLAQACNVPADHVAIVRAT